MLVSWAFWTTGHRTPQVATSTLLRLFMCLLGLVSPCRFWWTNFGLYARVANSLLTEPTFNPLFLNFHSVKNQIVTSDVSLFLYIVRNFDYSLFLPWAWKFVTFYFCLYRYRFGNFNSFLRQKLFIWISFLIFIYNGLMGLSFIIIISFSLFEFIWAIFSRVSLKGYLDYCTRTAPCLLVIVAQFISIEQIWCHKCMPISTQEMEER